MREMRGSYRDLVGKREGKRPLGKVMGRREDNSKWVFKKWEGIDLA
jgi:hypothetical protein